MLKMIMVIMLKCAPVSQHEMNKELKILAIVVLSFLCCAL